MMKTKLVPLIFILITVIFGCTSALIPTPTALPPSPTVTLVPTVTPVPTNTPVPSPTATATAPTQPQATVPNFDHIVMIMFENKEFGSVIGNSSMPYYNQLAKENTLLTQFYAVTHPSLPNYIALMSGDTHGIVENCHKCFVNAPSLPDLIEATGRTWKTYQEDMPSPCFIGDTATYVQKHNPFIYFDPIRTDAARCERSVVSLTALQTDIEAGSLPNYIFIMPNLCNTSHDCEPNVADAWLKNLLDQLIPALDESGDSYLIIMMFEEGQGKHSCCGLPAEAGGRVPVVLYSPLVKNGFEDSTPYTHYSLLKTISTAWGLPLLGHAAEHNNVLITASWK